ncbi:SPRY-domain-containing protein [Fistulina hepatica ATCC 64428]|uniref:SPRY-domain-containing protein n=1 Tax=Fistulina hepatica ATCC 64428 TaxID=1128425 RepID=A0A0D7A5S3_9AGAR|nr:SPRY-domain-containing protein [Fistulina hepatica ATCC 64428]
MSPSDSEDDGSPSPPPRDWIPAVPPPPPVSADSRVIRLPSQWSSSARYPTLSLSPDCRELSSDVCSADKESPAARTDHPAPPACGVYYFEVRVSSKSSKSCALCLFASKDAKLSRLPGWDSHSWGYYGEDGCTLYGDRNGRTYADGFGNGDIIGCCIDFTSRKAFFTKNGRFLGPAFDNIPVNVDLYPSVGFRQNNESVRVNLGQEPFKFNIEEHVQERKSVVWQRIMSTPLSGNISSSEEDKDDIKETMYELVMEYLAHHGYSGTAKALRNQHADEVTLVSKAGIDVEMADAARRDAFKDVDAEIELRTSIVGMVAAGRIEEAMSATREHFPGALEIEDGLLLLKLRCRRFVELILDASDLQKRMDSPHRQAAPSRVDVDDDDLGMDMDIDDDAPVYASNGHTSSTPLHVDGHEKALSDALAYGRALWTDYKHASEERRTIVERAFCVVAFSDPREVGGLPAEVSSIETRIALSAELNQAILKCQGKPTRPALEMMYQHTAACVQQLGVLGVGEAAFADMYGEIIADDSYNTTNLLQPKPDFLGQSSEFGLRLV